jgi:hypothetical protein
MQKIAFLLGPPQILLILLILSNKLYLFSLDSPSCKRLKAFALSQRLSFRT